MTTTKFIFCILCHLKIQLILFSWRVSSVATQSDIIDGFPLPSSLSFVAIPFHSLSLSASFASQTLAAALVTAEGDPRQQLRKRLRSFEIH